MDVFERHDDWVVEYSLDSFPEFPEKFRPRIAYIASDLNAMWDLRDEFLHVVDQATGFLTAHCEHDACPNKLRVEDPRLSSVTEQNGTDMMNLILKNFGWSELKGSLKPDYDSVYVDHCPFHMKDRT